MEEPSSGRGWMLTLSGLFTKEIHVLQDRQLPILTNARLSLLQCTYWSGMVVVRVYVHYS